MASKGVDGESVRVALRIRPLVESEITRGCVKCLETTPGDQQVLIKDLAFTYNHVFPPEVSQSEFYTTSVKGLVEGLFKGYNVTILAYGQTGSGKTHSMGTAYSGAPGEEMGVIPRAIRDIFSEIQMLHDQYDFRVQVSFMELYQEQLFDLLSTRVREQSIVDIREDSNKGIVMPGLTEKQVYNSTDTIECLIRGSQRRAVGATAMNSQSSRSHAIFTIYIQQQKLHDENSLTTSKFHLVDLAGSERANKTKATGNRFREGIKINEGLLALGNVISRLGEGNTGFIGYRDSKLTRLLQDSLGGNSMTLMIACVSPADYNLEETISTLRYADRARKIKNKPVVNQDPKAAEINRLKSLVNQYRLELLGKSAPENGDGDHSNELVANLRKEVLRLKQKNSKLMQDIDDYVIETACMNEKVILAEAANDRMNQKLLELKAVYDQTLNDLTNSGFEFKTAENSLQSMREKIDEIQHEQKKSSEEIQCHEIQKEGVSRASSKYNGLHEENALEITESITDVDAEAKQETHVMHQAALTTELHELNRELCAKQALAAQIAQNYQDMAEYKTNIRDNEDIIAKLQKERDELMQQIRNMQSNNASTKISEERRRRVHQLESEISELQKKVIQLAKVLKLKEKNDLRIVTLNTEIQQMKANKVKLIRTMRAESESFRSWKKSRERELSKLRDQDRKRTNEMSRMQHMHGKQQNVLKRKVEEAIAINKRLKEALDRQKNAQTRRLQIGQGKADQVRSWVEQELEVFLSTVDAERTLEQLMEDRAMIQRRIDAMKLQPINRGNSVASDIAHERKQLEEDLALRTAQIADFQEKIIASDQENKCKTRWDVVQSMVEAKAALRHLFEMAADMRRDTETHKGRSKDLESQQSETALKLLHCEEDIRRLREKHREQKAELEKEHEYKISILLRQIRTTESGEKEISDEALKQRIEIQNLALEQMDDLQAELDKYKEQCAELQKQLQSMSDGNSFEKMSNDKFSTPPNKKQKTKSSHKQHLQCSKIKSVEEFIWDSDYEIEDDTIRDPDFKNTPLYKKLQKTKMESSKRASTAIKRNIDGEIRCTCKGACSNRVCGCNKMNVRCSASCKCSSNACKNRSDTSSNDESQLHARSSSNSIDSDSTYKKSR